MARSLLEEEPGTDGVQGGARRRLIERYPSCLRAAKLAAGSGIGFLDTEIILTTGTYLLYGRQSTPPAAFYSPFFLALNIIAFVLGVTVAFFVSESLIFQGETRKSYSIASILERLGKFQLIFLAGNLGMVAVEMLMLEELAFPPVLGIIVGAIVSFPISYFFSTRFVWQIRSNDSRVVCERSKGFGGYSSQRKIRQNYLRNPMGALPERILTPYGNYSLDVEEYHFDVFPDKEETKIEFAMKVDVARED